MSMMSNMAFSAMEHFIREEAEKLIAGNVNSAVVNNLLSGLGVKIKDLSTLQGAVTVRITNIRITFTGTALKVTETRTLQLPDKEIELKLDQKYADPQKTGPAGKVKFSSTVELSQIGFSKSIGAIKATINDLSLDLAAEGSAETELK